MKDIAIIGAGASGLVAAIQASRAGAKVSVFEKNAKIGKKILATGNGRCNITNKTISVENFHGKNPSFVKTALNTFDTNRCKTFFSELGIEMVEGAKGRLYPSSLQSSSVVELLIFEAQRLGVKFFCNSEVKEIEKQDNFFTLHVEEKRLLVKRVLIATGGLAMPNLGSCDSGYVFAQRYGHALVKPHPSLTQLLTKETLKDVSGIKVQGAVALYVDKKLVQEAFGDILFTNYGLSGSAILDISSATCKNLLQNREVTLKLDLLPHYTKEQLKSFLKKRLQFSSGKSIQMWLNGFINSKLATFISQKITIKNADDLSMKDIGKLAFLLKEFSVHVEDTKGFKSAEVTAGGVDTKDINPATMESKLQKNLYFSGEVIDIDGDCGGYNLHWAWASGYLAGKSMVK